MKKVSFAVAGLTLLLATSCGTMGTGATGTSSTSAVGSVLGSVLSSATSTETLGNVLSSVIGLDKLSASSLYGTWKYEGPGCAFTSENALAKAGGEVVATQIEDKLKTEYSKLGLKSGNTYFTFNQDGTFEGKVDGKSISGKYTFNAKDGSLKLQGLLLSLTGYATRNGSNGISLLFESKKLLTAFQTLSALSGNSTLSTIGDISKNYDGVRLGFDLKK